MSHRSPQDPLREVLRTLPRARPADDFTERVLERARVRHRSLPRKGTTLRWAAAAALAAAVFAGALSLPRSPVHLQGGAAERDRRDRIEALEAERRRLAAELDEIRRLASSLREPAPVLYLGGDEEVDLVVDLDRLVRERPASAATPVDHRARRTH